MNTQVTVLHFNDFHRKLQPLSNGNGGAARLVGQLRALQDRLPNCITVNGGDTAGDNTQPGPDQFQPIPQIFNRARVDLLGLGNHEFEDPSGHYQTLQDGLIGPFEGEVVNANVRDGETGQLLPNTQPFVIKEVAGVKIGFTGVTTPDVDSKVYPEAGKGIHVAPLQETLTETVAEMRRQGADAIVVMAHEGAGKMLKIAEETSGVPLWLPAHDHKEFLQSVGSPDGQLSLVAEAGAYGANIGVATFLFDENHHLLSVTDELIPVNASSPIDPETEKIVAGAPVLDPVEIGAEEPKETVTLHSLQELAEHLRKKQ